MLALAAVLYTWALSRNGMGNAYYAAAVKSGTVSWKALLFGSLDPGSFITIDKPPASLWVMELSGRVFGFSSWSMLLPEALAGVATVYLVHRVVRKWMGDLAAVLSALAVLLTPVATLMFRFNNPDGILTFFLVASAAALWAALESGKTRWLVLCAVLVGVAFMTKWLAAFVVLPALGSVYLACGSRRLRARVLQLVGAAVALVVSGGWWLLLVEVWPAGSRPYIGNSTGNSVLSVVFGYDGFSRITGNGGPAPGGGGGFSFGAPPGWLRLFDGVIGGQIGWLIPFAAGGLLAGLWVTRRHRRTDLERAGWILWGGWAVVEFALFSAAQGIFHPYYTVALAPPIGVLAGAGAIAMWRAGRNSRFLAWVLPVAVAGSSVWAVVLLGRTPGYDDWLVPIILATGGAAALVVAILLVGSWRPPLVIAAAAAVGAVSLLAGPSAYSLTTARTSVTGPTASAGPTTRGGFATILAGFAGAPPGGPDDPASRASAKRFAKLFKNPAFVRTVERLFGIGPSNGSLDVDRGLVSYLEDHRASSQYLVAVSGSQQSAPLITATGAPVITMGGFMGTDPVPTVAQLQGLVASGRVHYVYLSAFGFVGFGAPGRPPGGPGHRFGGPRTAFGSGGFASPPGVAGRRRFPAGTAPGALRPPATQSELDQLEVRAWVIAHGTAVPSKDYGGGTLGYTLYFVP